MGERYITESEFRNCIQKLVGMIENGASKKEALDCLNSLIQDRMTVLNQIKQVLDEYGFKARSGMTEKAALISILAMSGMSGFAHSSGLMRIVTRLICRRGRKWDIGTTSLLI